MPRSSKASKRSGSGSKREASSCRRPKRKETDAPARDASQLLLKETAPRTRQRFFEPVAPFADQLYEFARSAPDLLAALQSLQVAIASMQSATQPLQEAVDSLVSTQASLADALFHMPRPTEYEPLAEPLREFARRSPPLLLALEALPRTVALLDDRLRCLEQSRDVEASVSPSAAWNRGRRG